MVVETINTLIATSAMLAILADLSYHTQYFSATALRGIQQRETKVFFKSLVEHIRQIASKNNEYHGKRIRYARTRFLTWKHLTLRVPDMSST